MLFTDDYWKKLENVQINTDSVPYSIEPSLTIERIEVKY